MFEKLRKFVALTEQAEKIRDSGATWETIYDLIFSDNIIGAVRKLGLQPEYYDPDTYYEDDVRAYVQALREKADEYEKILESE